MENKNNMINTLRRNDSTLLQLLYSVLIIAILILSILIFGKINVRENTNVIYNITNNTYIVNDEDIKSPVYLSDNWVFVPNFQKMNIRYNSTIEGIKNNYPHAEHVEITDRGWSDLGYIATAHNIDSIDAFTYDINYFNSIPTQTAAYMTTIDYTGNDSTIYLDLGEITGHAYVYCNNHYIGEAGDEDKYAILPNYNSGHNSNEIQITNHKLEIIIICYSNARVANPGLKSTPTLISSKYNIVFSTLPVAWISVLFTMTILAILAGMHLGRTLKDNRIYYFFVFTIINVLLFNLVDNNFFIMDSLTKQAAKLLFFIAAAAFSYCFISFLFNSRKFKRFGNCDCIVVSCIGIAFITLSFLDSRLINTPYNEVCAIIYASILAGISIIKVLFFHLNSKNAMFGSFASITTFFTFFTMLSQANLLCNISLYSIFYFGALVGILISFIRRYVLQYSELVNNATHLKLAIEQKTAHISEINRDLVNTNKKLLSNEEARKNVMSNVSHDLRTPITAIRGYAELLLKGGQTLSDEQRDTYLNNILKRSQQMERIVSDIVEISKMESTNFEFNFMDMSLNELLDEIYMLFLSETTETKKLTIDLPEDDFLIVKADPKRLSRVFENLISNAFNYTNEDAVIAIKAWRENPDSPLADQNIHITISDNGIGIPADEVERIFDRFYRAKNSGQNIKGTGLGLSIVKMIIDKHDATISVESSVGVGTTFHIIMKPTY